MRTKEWDPATVFDLFGDPLARCILVLASRRPRSAEQLADELDVSLPTIYRRTNELAEFDLLAEHLRADEDKNQYRVFETTLRRISFEIDDGECNVDIRMKRQLDDRFEAFWTDLGRTSSGDAAGVDRPEGYVDDGRFLDSS